MSIPAVSVIDQVSSALSVASLQNKVIASNIANRDTQGYQRLQVRFDEAMERAGVQDGVRGGVSASIVAEPTDADASAPVSLEQDLVALSTNTGRYGALARSLSRYFSIMNAITNYSRG
jgi:flagellar basal body rod protein FlgB